MARDYNRSYDYTDLIVKLQRDQNAVMLDGTETITVYVYTTFYDSIKCSDNWTVATKTSANYDIDFYDDCYYA